MKVTVDLEQGPWVNFIMKCQAENTLPNEVLNAWIKRACRQQNSILPGVEKQWSKVVEFKK